MRFDASKLADIEKVRSRLLDFLHGKRNNLRVDIKLANQLSEEGDFIPVVSYWEYAERQDDFCILRKMQVLIYNLLADNWTRYTKNY